jgi:hypothetical protein
MLKTTGSLRAHGQSKIFYDLIELSSITGALEYIQNRYSGCAFETTKSRAGTSIAVPASFDTLRNGTRKICRATPEG